MFKLKLPPTPDTIDQEPIPTAGALAVNVVEVTPHKPNWSGPALATVGLLGKKVGEISEVTTPGGVLNFEILDITR